MTSTIVIIVYALIFLAIAGLFLYSLIDVLKNEYEGNNKIIWVLVIILMPIIGSVLYLGIGSNQKI